MYFWIGYLAVPINVQTHTHVCTHIYTLAHTQSYIHTLTYMYTDKMPLYTKIQEVLSIKRLT